MSRHSVHVLYVGTTKLLAVRGTVQDDGTMTIERFVKIPPLGIERGAVVNVDKASQQIKELMKGLGEDIDYTRAEFYVVLSNEYLRNYLVNSSLYFGEIMKPIAKQDIERAIAQTKSVATIPLDEHIIEEVPQEFIVNDMHGIIDPLELEARRLGVNLLLFTVHSTIIRNLMKVLERVDIVCDHFIPRALASQYAVLREEERRDGIVMVDIGGYVTDVIYIKNSILQSYQTLAVGGETISQSLAAAFNISQTEARRLKERFGSAVLVTSFEDEIIPVVDVFGKTKLSLNKKRLYDHLFVSAKDLLDAVKPAIETIRKNGGVVSGIVLTGGGALLEGMTDVCQETFGVPVRLGVSRKINGPKEVITSAQYTAVAGVLGYVLDGIKKDDYYYRNKSFITRKVLQVKEWIQEYF